MKRGTMPQPQDETDRPRVLISANSFWNIKNFRSALIEALVAEGWDVLIAAPEADGSWFDRPEVTAVPITLDRSGMNPLRDLMLILAYHKLIRFYRPTIFLGFTAKPNIYGPIAARFSNVPCLPNVSGLGTAFINAGLLTALVSRMYRMAFARCPIVFFQNPDDLELFVERNIVRPKQGRLLPGSGVDLDRFKPNPSGSGSEIRFLLIGRLLGDKGVREFVDAARALRAEHPQWRFHMLGPIDPGNRTGIGRGELNGWVAEGTVDYLGQTEDVRPHIDAATAVVLPSYREGLPRSLLEAAAMAKPLVATNVPGNRRIVEHGVNGLLCQPRSAVALAEAMRTIGLMNDAERQAMGSAGRAIVERGFGEQQVIRAYLEAMAQLQRAARS